MTRLLHHLGLVATAGALLACLYGGRSPLFAADEPGLFGKKGPPADDEMADEAAPADEDAADEDAADEDGGGEGVESGLGNLRSPGGDWADDDGDTTKPQPKRRPGPSDGKAANADDAARVDALLDAAEGVYEKRIDSPDWVSRALATTSLARSPRVPMIERLLGILERDKHPVVKLLAWQGVLARAGDLDKPSHARWLDATYPMAERGWFNGPLRARLLDVLATAPATPRARRIYGALFDTANAWEPQDVAALDAMGKCLAAWQSAPVAEALAKRLSDPGACVRAEYVLLAAGSTARPARELVGPTVWDPFAKERRHPGSAELWAGAQAGHVGWLKTVRKAWKQAEGATGGGGEPWRDLAAQYVPAPVPLSDIDPDDPRVFQFCPNVG